MHACNQLNLINLFALLEFEKFQAPKYKSKININDQNSKQIRWPNDIAKRYRYVLAVGAWNLRIVIWDLSHPFSKI